MSILSSILEEKRDEVARRKEAVPPVDLDRLVRKASPPRSLLEAISPRGGKPGGFRVIAEVKKASPSRGVIREDFDPVRIAEAYERGGAAAISVLTDGKRFQGSLEHLAAVRARVRLPVLRKDFVVDSYQVREARAAGADAILLILAALPDDGDVRSLAAEAGALGMDVLYEVHEEGEMRRALAFGPRIVGINNRDLRTFEVRLETTRTLAPLAPEGVVLVSESGFSRREELEAMRGWRVGAFLIGETLLRAPDPGDALRALLGGGAP